MTGPGQGPGRLRRLVSLCPSTTESLAEMGFAPSLVGVTRYCVRPSGLLEGIPQVGGTKDPDHARIASLSPDLLFLNSEENRREDIDALAARFRFDLSHPRRVRDVPPLLRRWAAASGSAAAGEAAAERVESGLRVAEDSLASRRPFRYVALVWREPWVAAGEETYLADLVRLAGGIPALAPGLGDWRRPAIEELRAARPDVVLLPDDPYPFRERHRTELEGLLPGARALLLAGQDWCWHGTGTLRGLAAARALAGSLPA